MKKEPTRYPEKVCTLCGVTFVPTNYNQLRCSRQCVKNRYARELIEKWKADDGTKPPPKRKKPAFLHDPFSSSCLPNRKEDEWM